MIKHSKQLINFSLNIKSIKFNFLKKKQKKNNNHEAQKINIQLKNMSYTEKNNTIHSKCES